MIPSPAIPRGSLLPHWQALRPFSAEIWLIITIVAVLLVPFFVRRRINVACAAVTLVGLALAVLSLLINRADGGDLGFQFNGLLVFDTVAFAWKLILLCFVAGVIVLQLGSTLLDLHPGDGPELYTLLLGATLGMCLMGSTSNLLMLFMAVELSSLSSYLLAGFRKTHRLGAEASLKYVLFGASVTAVMAYGLSLLYGLCGTLNLSAIASGVPLGGGGGGGGEGGGALFAIALLTVIAGLGFKISAVPFHFWCPDVFDGASIDITTFLSVASKGAGLILLLRFLQTIALGAGPMSQPLLHGVAIAIGVLAILTMTVGNTAALAQTRMKRLLAYSSIAQAGYMLAALSLLSSRRGISANADTAAASTLLYLAVYAVMNLGAFTVAAAVERATGDGSLAAFNGLGRRAPLLAGAMLCCMISLIGLPPLAGFAAKLTLLWALVRNGGWVWALAAALVLNTILSVFYYFRIIRAMYLQPGPARRVHPQPLLLGLGAACAVALLAFFFAFSPLSRAASGNGHLILNDSPAILARR